MARPVRAALAVVFLLGVFLAVVGVGLSGPAVAQADNETAAGNASFGAQMASFMQATAAEANGTVEQGLWNASVDDDAEDGGDDLDRRVRARAQRLEQQLDALTNRTAALSAESRARHAAVNHTARASALRARLAMLRSSIDDTTRVARRHGADGDDLRELRERAGTVSGPAVAAAARTITDAGRGPPERADDGERGPPEDSGPPDGADDRGRAPEENGGGPSTHERDRGSGGGGGDRGPPDNGGPSGPPAGDTGDRSDSAADRPDRSNGDGPAAGPSGGSDSSDSGDGGSVGDSSGGPGPSNAGSGDGSSNAGSGDGSSSSGSDSSGGGGSRGSAGGQGGGPPG